MMHRVIQVIGLPGAGKTTSISSYAKLDRNLTRLNCDYKGFNKAFFLKRTDYLINNSNNNIIIESACGFKEIASYVIKLEPPLSIVYKQLFAREKKIDEDYLSLLQTQMIKPNKIVISTKELIDTLVYLLEPTNEPIL